MEKTRGFWQEHKQRRGVKCQLKESRQFQDIRTRSMSFQMIVTMGRDHSLNPPPLG